MTEWKKQRFWKRTGVAETAAGHEVHLDGRPVRTPAKATLALPTRRLAEAIAAEWDAQGEVIDPGTMPLTRTANSAVDAVAPQFDEIVAIVAAYGETDLLCYRAEGPESLVAEQAAGWDPLIDWAAVTLRAPLILAQGVMHVRQPETSIATLREEVARLDHWQLAAFHDLVTLTGSLILGFAAIRGRLPREECWRLSRLDEIWQASQWGTDAEAAAIEAGKARSFEEASRFFDLATSR